jgi:predicted permease
VFGRLKSGVTVAQAQQEMSSIAARLEREHPGTNTGLSITVRPLLDKVVSGIRSTLLALMSMVTFVLLIACANVSSSMLARAAGRQQEVAVRLALGARPWQVVRQLLTESLLLASAGAVVGLALAAWGVHRLMTLVPPGSLPRQQEVGLDSGVYMAATLATLIAGVATGLVPAVQIVRPGLVQAFHGGPRGATEPRGGKRARSLLVGAQVALALVLTVGAGLMGRTMVALNRVDPGFRVDHLAVAGVSLAGTPHADPDARYAMYERIRGRLEALPGVISVSAINHLPLAGDVWNMGYTIEGRAPPAPGQRWSAVYRVVEPGYFSTAGIRLLAGRDFSSTDRGTSIPVAIISKGMADRRWPGGGALGQRLHLPGPSNLRVPLTIVGIAGDARQGDWTSPPADEVYVALAQRAAEFGLAGLTFLLRTSTDPAAAAASVPGAIGELDRGVAVSSVTTMEAVMADAIWRQRLTAQLTGAFALVALVLAGIGIYAAVGYEVTRRTREFGVRMALGGSPHQMLGLALADGLRPVLAGAALGVIVALGVSQVAQRLLFGVAALDPLAFGLAVLTILFVGAGAAWVPARRASRQDPMAALRER